MTRIMALACGAAALLACAGPLRLHAQADMRDGTWTGWLQQSDEDSIAVTYAVSHYGKHLLITLRGRSGISYDMAGAKVKNDVLSFDWPMALNSSMYCRLTRRDGRSFEGTCNDRSPGTAGKPIRVWMLMTPPAGDSTARPPTSRPGDPSS